MKFCNKIHLFNFTPHEKQLFLCKKFIVMFVIKSEIIVQQPLQMAIMYSIENKLAIIIYGGT
jgi:hypothetical protein